MTIIDQYEYADWEGACHLGIYGLIAIIFIGFAIY
jgi:hypothetical protein